MRFPERKWIFAGMLPIIVLVVMVPCAFCETPGFPPEYENIEAQIFAASQESILRCSDCHTPMAQPHHAAYFGADPNTPYNPYCPEVPPSSGDVCQPCHYHYNSNCEWIWPMPYPLFGNGCVACHALSESCTFELGSLTAECIAQLLPGQCHQQPQTPPEMIQELTSTVIELNLQQGISNSLDAKLETALSALDDVNTNNDVAAINSLNAFINAVEAQRGNKITNEDADMLIAAAQAIIDKLESP